MEFDRGYTSDRGLDLLAAIKQSSADAELRANTGNQPSATMLQQQQQQQGGSSSALQQQHRRSGSVSGSGPVMIDQASLRKLNETVPAATLRELGIEEGDSLFVRSSYAYDHVDSGAGVQDLGEEVSAHVDLRSTCVIFDQICKHFVRYEQCVVCVSA
jgi:hypothetical protein